jgi:hypothetical protein
MNWPRLSRVIATIDTDHTKAVLAGGLRDEDVAAFVARPRS